MKEEYAKLPLLGDFFPEMEVKTTHGTKMLPGDYKGKWVVLFSHPGDFTPVCTTEFVEFSKRANDFSSINTELVGLSVDQVFSHLKWVEWINENTDVTVPFPIIADELGIVSKSLGMLHPGKGTNTVRAVFIMDPESKIRLMMYYPQEIGRSVDEVIRALKALQMTDKHKVAAPENYPNNSWLGDSVIVPPAGTEQLIAQRLKEAKDGSIECLDWWLCHKKIK